MCGDWGYYETPYRRYLRRARWLARWARFHALRARYSAARRAVRLREYCFWICIYAAECRRCCCCSCCTCCESKSQARLSDIALAEVLAFLDRQQLERLRVASRRANAVINNRLAAGPVMRERDGSATLVSIDLCRREFEFLRRKTLAEFADFAEYDYNDKAELTVPFKFHRALQSYDRALTVLPRYFPAKRVEIRTDAERFTADGVQRVVNALADRPGIRSLRVEGTQNFIELSSDLKPANANGVTWCGHLSVRLWDSAEPLFRLAFARWFTRIFVPFSAVFREETDSSVREEFPTIAGWLLATHPDRCRDLTIRLIGAQATLVEPLVDFIVKAFEEHDQPCRFQLQLYGAQYPERIRTWGNRRIEQALFGSQSADRYFLRRGDHGFNGRYGHEYPAIEYF